MKRDITVGADLGGVFSSGAFENLKPRFDFSGTYKNVEKFPAEQFEADLLDAKAAHEKVYLQLYKQLELCEEQAKQKAIEKFHKNIRWYDVGKGLRFPSVTSVIDFANPIEWFVDDLKKRGLAARGMVVDHVLQHFIKEGKWVAPEKLPSCLRHLQIMKDAGYEVEGNFPAFVEKFKVKFTTGHMEVVNFEHGYAGQPDCECTFGTDKSIVLVDLKCFSPNAEGKLRTLKQTAAYAMCGSKATKIGIIPIHGKTVQGYSKPVITDEIKKYFELFLEDRKVFRDTFGI